MEFYRDYMGITEKKMENTRMSYIGVYGVL